MHDPRAVRFSWMDSSCYDYDFFPHFFCLCAVIVSDDQHWNIHPSKSRSDWAYFNKFNFVFTQTVLVRVSFGGFSPLVKKLVLCWLDLSGQVCDHTVGIRQRVCKKNLVIIVFKSVIPSQLIVNPPSRVFRLVHWLGLLPHYFAKTVLKVAASKRPSRSQILRLFDTQDLHRHPLLVQRVLLS